MSDDVFTTTVPRLATSRLLLRELRAGDFDAYYASFAELNPSAPAGTDRHTAWRIFASAAGLWMLRGAGWWSVELRSTGEWVGTVGAFRREGFEDFEVGWSLVPGFRSRGFATEAGRAALAFGFDVCAVPRIVAHIDAPNTPSIRVAERLGMHHDGEVAFQAATAQRYVVERG